MSIRYPDDTLTALNYAMQSSNQYGKSYAQELPLAQAQEYQRQMNYQLSAAMMQQLAMCATSQCVVPAGAIVLNEEIPNRLNRKLLLL